MATNLAIDDKLILKALKVGSHKTKKEAVTIALKDYITRKTQEKIISLFCLVVVLQSIYCGFPNLLLRKYSTLY